MTENAGRDALANLIDARVSGAAYSLDGLDDNEALQAAGLLNVADLLWEAAHGAPPLDEDPVAAMLGLVPDARRSLDGPALKRALMSSGLTVSVLAQKLAARGWEVATRDVFAWQTGGAVAVPPALIQAIAEETRTTADQLTVDRGESPARRSLKSLTSTPRFLELAERWARLRGTSVNLAASALEARLATSVYRGAEPEEQEMLESLEVLVASLESKESSDEAD